MVGPRIISLSASIFVLFLLMASSVPLLGGPGPEALIPKAMGSYIEVAVDNDLRIWGDRDTKTFGASVASGDLDGDGYDDIAIGVPESDYGRQAGAVLIYFARDREELEPAFGFASADTIIEGINEGDRFGYTVEIEDLDSDGRSELIASAPYGDGPGNGRRDTGDVYIVEGMGREEYGHVAGIENLTSWGVVYGKDAGDHLGVRIAFGDLDGNGTVDMVLCSEGTGGTADCKPEGGTNAGAPNAENGIIGSWEVDVILRKAGPLGTYNLADNTSSVRWYGADTNQNSDNNLIAWRIGNGIGAGDFDGDGIDDIVFTYRLGAEGYLALCKGGPSFPYIGDYYKGRRDYSYVFPYPGFSSNNPHPMFYPNLTIELGTDGYEEALLCTGEANGDQIADILVGMTGAPARDSYRHKAGQVDLYLGGPITATTLDRTDAVWTFYGTDAGDRMGSSLAMIDRDSDGKCEFFVGSPYSDGQDNEREGAGELFGFYFGGAFQRTSMEMDADLMVQGRAGFGSFKDLAGSDMDDNGYPEIVISSPGAPSPQGAGYGLVTLTGFDGSYEASFSTPVNVSAYGTSVHFGDLDNDGFTDLVIGSKYDASDSGPVDVYFNPGMPWNGNYFDAGSKDITYEEDKCLGVADLDDNGYDDIVLSIRGQGASGHPGNVFIYWGGSRASMVQKSMTQIYGYENSEFGWAMAVGDVNGDGTDDLALSAHLANGGTSSERAKSGKVHLWYGPLSHTGRSAGSSSVVIDGAASRDQIGDSLLISDLDDDGYGEIVIGSEGAEPGSITDQGSVTVIKGGPSLPSRIDLSTYAVLRIDGEWPYDNLGSSLASGDLDQVPGKDLLMAAAGNDGFERWGSNNGALYMLTGAYVKSVLNPGGGTVQLRRGSNLTIYGSQIGETMGRGLCVSDTDGDSMDEISIGSPNWFHQDTRSVRGAVAMVLSPEGMTGKELNSSDLPRLLGPDDSGFGASIASGLIDGDAKGDLVIGAPFYDPDQDGSSQGGAFLWLSKSLLARDIKVRPVEYLNPGTDVSDTRGPGATPVLEPMEGPYMMRVAAVTAWGSQTVTDLGLRVITEWGSEAEVRYVRTNRTFVQVSDPDLAGKLRLLPLSSEAWEDGGVNIRADFAVKASWDMVDPSMIVTFVRTSSGDSYNFRTALFEVDRSLYVADHQVHVDGLPSTGWLNGSTTFSVENVTVVHGRTGRPLSAPAMDSLDLSLLRPDGFKIGTGVRYGPVYGFGPTTVGSNITGTDRPFRITLDTAVPGLEWSDDVVLLNVDTYSPPLIPSFKVFNDGLEGGINPIDDDPYVEVVWGEIRDLGDSGIATYRFHIISKDLGTHIVRDDVEPHDLVQIPQGDVSIGLQAVDRARNEGPINFVTVLSDLSEPVFFSETPKDNSWLKEGSMTVTVKVADNTSGLDIASAQVRYYIAQTGFLSAWLNPTGLMEQGGGYTLSFEMPRIEGILNYVQWGISDTSGRASISRPFYYNVDLTVPTISVDTAMVWATGDPFNLTTTIMDPLSGLDLASVSYRFGPKDIFFALPFEPLGLKGYGAAAYPSVTVDPDFSGQSYLQWKATDRAGNSAESSYGIYYIDDKMPILDSIVPDQDTVVGSDKVMVTATAVDMDSGLDRSGFEYSLSRMSDWVVYGVGGFSPWASVDKVSDIGGGFYQATINVTLDAGDFNFIKIRLKDKAGNGWVEGASHRVRVSTYKENMPPVARFEVIPFVDEIRQGEIIKLDASSSYDPENTPLSYRWYSDIERYPLVSLLGNESVIDITLNTTGVQRIWLEVSDGRVTVRSEEVMIRVLPAKGSSGGEGTGSAEDAIDYFPFILLALVLGLLVGIIGSYFVLRRKEEKVVPPPPILEEAKMEVDYHPISCPYCKAEVRTTDTYCMKCGTVFTASDIEAMRSDAMGARPSKKRSRLELQQPSDESILPPSMEGEPMFLEGAEEIEAENPEDEVEFEDISEIEEDDEEDEDWEVRP